MIYVIGDVHGMYSSLCQLYNKILEDIKNTDDPFGNTILFVGDYVDRGHHSKQVLDMLMNFTNSDKLTHIFLMGNHEAMMIEACDKHVLNLGGVWIVNGGYETLKSFSDEDGVDYTTIKLTLSPYIEWMKKNLKIYHETSDYIFIHSGLLRLDSNFSMDTQPAEYLLWGKSDRYRYKNFHKTVVHGHTPTKNKLPLYDANKICVDVGCGKDTDSLACVVLPNFKTEELLIPRFIQI